MRLIMLKASLAFVLALTLAAEARDGQPGLISRENCLRAGYVYPCGRESEIGEYRRRYPPTAGNYCMTSFTVTGSASICSYDDLASCMRVVEGARARQILPWILSTATCRPNSEKE